MCGILGVADLCSGPVIELGDGLTALRHRGPDAAGTRLVEGSTAKCAFAHARLRIIDLSPEADQPLANEDETIWVSYNGELYNHLELRHDLERAGHRFHSNSDTEVLVHLYEQAEDPIAMLTKLRGMFAFALFDARRDRLVLARDRLGIKPLYLAERGSRLAFSSETRALVRAGLVDGDPDLVGISGFLRWGVVPAERTIFSGVRELAPGSVALWEQGQTREQRWWTPTIAPDHELAADGSRILRSAISDSVDRHMIADRPVGVFLSGGVDSGAVATLASQKGNVTAITVSFPEEAEDEAPRASALATRIGASHEVIPVVGSDVSAALPDIFRSMDQPTADGVNTWLVCRAARLAGLVVALSGLGGDELFLGYPSFTLVPKAARARLAMSMLPAGIRRSLAKAIGNRWPGGTASRLLPASRGLTGAYSAVRALFGPQELPQLDSSAAVSDSRKLGVRDRVTLFELDHYLPNQLLRDTDQMSMSHSLEVRVPLLDDNVTRVALSLPSDRRSKQLLAEVARLQDVVPKRPFSLPFERWMRGPLFETIRESLLTDHLPTFDRLSPSFRSRLWSAFVAGRVHWSRPWAIAVLRRWPEANGCRW